MSKVVEDRIKKKRERENGRRVELRKEATERKIYGRKERTE